MPYTYRRYDGTTSRITRRSCYRDIMKIVNRLNELNSYMDEPYCYPIRVED